MANGLLVPLGARLGDHIVDKFVGAGGLSEVYRARSVAHPGRVVALKVFLRAELSAGGEERFLREATALRDVRHDHLAEVYDHGASTDGRLLFYSMRFVEGETLHEVLEECERIGPPTPDHLRFLVARIRDVARALEELHRRGLVHRDVKPSNVILRRPREESDEEVAAVLVDYGLVRPAVPAHATRSTRQASLPYAAPEQLRDERVDARSDVFSLGATLFDVVCGRTSGHRGLAMFGLPPLVEQRGAVDADLAAIVDCATDLDPHWRYADARAMGEELDRWLAGKRAHARLPPWRRLRQWVRRHPHRVLRELRKIGVAVASTLAMALVVWAGERCISARGRAIEAWRRADVAASRAALAGWPECLDRWLLPADVAAAAPALRGRDQESRLGQVARAEQTGGGAAALRAALSWLPDAPSAEGLDLVRVAAFAFDEAAARGGAELAPIVRLLARHCYEAPDLDPAAVAQSAPLRERLERLLSATPFTAESESNALVALSALGGCANPATANRVVAWLPRAMERGGPCSIEACHLALRCLEWTALRSRRCGFAARLAEPAWRDACASLQARVASIEAGPESRRTELLGDLDAMLSAIVFVLRAPGSGGAGAPITGFGSDQPQFLSAMRDEAWERELLRRAATDTSFETGPDYAWFQQVGVLAGAFGRPRLVDEIAARLHARAEQQQLEVAWSDELFRRGVRTSEERSGGDWSATGIDADTTLRALAGRLQPCVSSPPARRDNADVSGAGEWDMTISPIVLRGAAGAVHAIDASVGAEEFDPRQPSFVVLGIPGRSELELDYRSDGRSAAAPFLALDVQKGLRRGFPYGGEARLEVVLDGVRIFEALAPTEGLIEWREPLPPSCTAGAGAHLLELRLHPESNTTLRLFRVRIGPASGR